MGEEDLLRQRGAAEVMQDEECRRMMQEFIAWNPGLWNEEIGV